LSIPPEEMITFPVKPDTNVSQIWPMSTWCWLLLGRHWYFRSNVHLTLYHII
jgi:hypothetical protein